MAEKVTMTDRDKALIGILERMADQIQKQDSLLEEVALRLNSFSRDTAEMDIRRDALHRRTEDSFQRLYDSLSRYRSDMLSLVNEQDHVNKNMAELQKLVNKASYSVEVNNTKVAALDELVKTQAKEIHEHNELFLKQSEKVTALDALVRLQAKEVHEHYELFLKQSEKVTALDALLKTQVKEFHAHYEHSLKQADILPREMFAANKHVTKLHTDTEKQLSKLHFETQKQIEKLQSDTLRRLLILDSFEAQLQTLLIRTEPPEKKTLWIVRLHNRISAFFRIRLPLFFRRLRRAWKEKDKDEEL
jgi:hypothetical protein